MENTLAIEDAGYLNLMNAAAELRIHPHSLRRLVKAGNGPPCRKLHGVWLFERAALMQFKSQYDPNPGRKWNTGGRLIE